MYWIEINGDKITGKGQSEFKTDEQVEVSEEIYNQLTNLPASYIMAKGRIASVTPELKKDIVAELTKEEILQQEIIDLKNRVFKLESATQTKEV